MAKTTDEINAEKAAKSRMDLVPPDHAELAGLAFKVGAEKHGLGPVGLGTYRIAGTEQSTVWSHWASMERHAAALKRGEMMDDGPGGTGLPHLACKCAQDAIIAALLQRPPGKVHPADRRWYAGRTDVVFAETLEEWAAQAEPVTAVEHLATKGYVATWDGKPIEPVDGTLTVFKVGDEVEACPHEDGEWRRGRVIRVDADDPELPYRIEIPQSARPSESFATWLSGKWVRAR